MHGDTAGVENLQHMLADWLTDMGLIAAGPKAGLARYVGYFEPYATRIRRSMMIAIFRTKCAMPRAGFRRPVPR